MSKKETFYGRTSKSLQDEFNEVCFALGREIGNERRAIENQNTLKDRQEELEKAFAAAIQREQEAAQQKAKAEAATKAFEAKTKVDEALTPSTTNGTGNDAALGPDTVTP